MLCHVMSSCAMPCYVMNVVMFSWYHVIMLSYCHVIIDMSVLDLQYGDSHSLSSSSTLRATIIHLMDRIPTLDTRACHVESIWCWIWMQSYGTNIHEKLVRYVVSWNVMTCAWLCHVM